MARKTAAYRGDSSPANRARRGAQNSFLTKADLSDALAPLQSDLDRHDRTLAKMEKILQQIAQTDTLGRTVENGLYEIAEKLKPLENLRPPLEPIPLEPRQRENLEELLDSLARPKWSDATSIPVPNDPVPFVGQTPAALPGRVKL